MQLDRFTQKAQEAIIAAQQAAERLQSPILDAEHILSALVEPDDGIPAETLRRLGVDLPTFRGEIASVHVAYMRFLSAGQQRPVVVQILPLKPEAGADGGAKTTPVEYEFSPEPRQLLDELLPAVVRAWLFQAFNDAAVSEQVARMVAMKAATDAAGDMIKALTREYNRARRSSDFFRFLVCEQCGHS